jgi:iron complex outermembrane receptor protein
MFSHKIKLSVAICALAACMSVHAQVHDMTIPGGELKSALDNYASQSGVQIIYKADDVKGLTTKGVQHAASEEQALAAILDNTGLRVKRDGANAIVIFRDLPTSTVQTDPAAGSEQGDTGVMAVTITSRKAGMGLMVQEDEPKARSTVNKEEIQKERTTGNAYQTLSLLPSVNTYNYDATGLFGGGMTMRGFNSTEIGTTINGVPINDSGSYAVYPEEFVDQENVCSEFVTQGSTDIDAPHVGATGGNLGVITCDPEEKRRIRVMQTVGGLNLSKTYARFDSGRFDDNRAKFFMSYSHAEADKWKGEGNARRDHIDTALRFDIDRFDYITASILINRMVDNNIYDPSLAELNAHGYYYDYAPTFIGHLPPVAGSAQTEASQSPAYYKLAINPFFNVIASATGKFRLNDSTDVKITPYFWYGYGFGGSQEKAMSESGFLNPATGKLVGVDLNGDGDTKDKILVAGSSVTRTDRPGVTASITETLDNNTIFGGVWLEQAHHRQTSPIVPIDNAGNTASIWLNNDQIDRPNGTPYQSRDWLTLSTAWQVFLQDTLSLMDDKLRFNFGVRDPSIKRDFTNYASEGAPVGVTYEMVKTFTDVLPQFGLRYELNTENQVFSSLSKNMQAPPNFAFSAATGDNVTIVNGQPVLSSPLKPETSWNLDIGYRYHSPALVAQATAFAVDFQNRLANAYDPNSGLSSYINAGGVKTHGLELEIGNTPISGWSMYGSFGYTMSKITNDIQVTSTQSLPTNGKEFPLTPKVKFGLSAQYETPTWYVRLKDQHTSSQWATLVNDEKAPGYNLADFDAGYLFSSSGIFKNPTLRLNVSNLFNAQYRNPASQSVLNATTINGISPGGVYYYLGAPRLVSASLQVDF